MTGRVIPTAVLVVMTAGILADIGIRQSGSTTDPNTTADADPAPVLLPELAEQSPRTPPMAEHTRHRSLEEDIRQLQEAVTALSRAVAALERDRIVQPAVNGDTIDAPFDAAPDAEPLPDFLTRQFESEPTDAAWAARNEPLISHAFTTGEISNSQLVYSSCKATVCRIEVSHDDAAAADNFMFQLLPLVSDDFATVTTRLIDDVYGLRSVVLLGNVD